MDDDDDEVYLIPVYLRQSDAQAIAEVYMQQAERGEFIRAVSTGVPASEVYTNIKLRRTFQ